MGNKKTSWVVLSAVLSIVLVVTFFAPAVFAQNTDAETQRLLSVFQQVYTFVQNNYVDPVESKVLIEGALKGMFESLKDQHSAYLTAEEMRPLSDTTSGEFGGVGLFINKQLDKEVAGRKVPAFIEVVSPIEDTPAYRAGIVSGDLIVKVESQSTESLAIDEVVNRLRGPSGSTVTVTVRRGESAVFDVKLVRAVIQVPTVKYAMMDDGIAFLRIIQFTPFTAAKVQEALISFGSSGFKKLVIDLRSNPGGLLNSVVQVADLFFEDGPIVSTKSRIAYENQVFNATPGSLVPAAYPIAVLIDGGSASAAEILAGVMKDRQRALLFGVKTYGKGSVQQVRSIGSAGFRLTTARYYTPSGVSIDKIGIQPDREVKEADYSEAELTAYAKLITDGNIRDFVKDRPNPSDDEMQAFAATLKKQNNVFQESVLRRMVRNEVVRHMPSPPVYDLAYDRVLQEAVKYLKGLKP
jgi:carboxyl-terminal processing protease